MKPAATSLGSQAQKMSDGLEKGWRLSYTMRPEEIRGVGMPEPQHRIGPVGVSSGISLRDFPKARLEDLTKICQHYEQKCSGVYASDSAAARYLFQLSREVQQVVAVLSQEKSIQTRAAEKAEKFFEEWKESFGPSAPLIRDASSLEIPLSYGRVRSSGEPGTGTEGDGEKDNGGEMLPSDGGDIDTVSPAKVADALRSLSFRVVNAKKETAEAAMEKESSMAGMRGVLDAHVSASAESSEANRLIHLEDRAAMVEQQKKVVETLREQHEQAIQQIIVEKDLEHNKSCESFKKQLNEVQLELLNNRQHTINTEAQWRKRVEDLEQRERAEASRMREHFQEQLARAKNEAAAAHAALGVSSVSEGGRRSGGGTRSSSGNGLGPDGGSDVDAGSDDHKVRSLSMMLEESRKECKWVRERNQELERVVEALRKTIMRQAEISSQRPDQQQGRMMSMHGHRGSRQPHLDHPHHGGGAGYSMGGPRGPRSGGDHSYQDTSGLTSRGGGGQHHHLGLTSSRDDDLLLHRNRQGGVHAGGVQGGGHRGHEESAAYSTRFHHQQQQHQGFNNGKVGNGGRVRSGVGVSGSMSSAGSSAIGRGGVGSRSHPHQMQQLPEAPSFRRYATHDSYEDGIGLPSSTGGAQLRQQHPTSRLLLRGVPGGGERGGTHPGNAPGSSASAYDRDLPDRGWSQSAPPLGNAGGPHGGAGGTMAGCMGGNHGVIGGRGGGIEYAAPVPRHHRQHEGGGHNLAAIGGSLSASNSAAMGKEGGSDGGVSASGVGGGGGARWDRDPPRDTMAFASSKYPPGCFPSGGVYGEGAIFEQVPLMDKRNGSFKGSPTSRGTVGSGVGGILRGNGDLQMQRQQQQEEAHMANSRSLGMLTGSPNTEGVVHAGRLMSSGGMKSNEASPDIGPSSGYDSGNGRGTVEGRERGGVSKEDDGDTGDFDFGEIDTAAVLGL